MFASAKLNIEQYKAKHHGLLKEATAVLQLALWKHKLNEGKEVSLALEDARAKKVKIDVESDKKRGTCHLLCYHHQECLALSPITFRVVSKGGQNQSCLESHLYGYFSW